MRRLLQPPAFLAATMAVALVLLHLSNTAAGIPPNPPVPAPVPVPAPGFSPTNRAPPANPRLRDDTPPTRAADLAVIISVDGLRPDAIDGRAPRMRRLQREGTSARNAFTIRNSSTLPSHAAMVSGVSEQVHGLNFNGWRPEYGAIRFPTIFRAARAAGMSTALFVAKRKLQHLVETDGAERFEVGTVRCEGVVARAAPHLRRVRSGVVFVHFADPDLAGHRRGWMTPLYRRAVAASDGCVGSLVDALGTRRNRALVLVTSDHGGAGRSHGGGREVDRRIPWIAWGGAARRGVEIERRVKTEDTAATVLTALGLPAPEGIEGRPVLEALR